LSERVTGPIRGLDDVHHLGGVGCLKAHGVPFDLLG
jgi:hypothetical protein